LNFYITILGSGAALPTGHRRCSAQVVNINGFKLLLDCAEGTQDRIRQHHLKLQSLGTVLISHLHGDHFFGLAPLLSTMHLCGRTEPVTVIAPKGAKEVIETTFALTGNHISYPLEFIEMDFSEGMHRVFENHRCTIDAFPIVHSVPTYGFRITATPPRPSERGSGGVAYTYCCDTAYTEDIIPYIQDSDLLCLECTFANELSDLARDRQHLTAEQAGRLAALAGARRLMLTHISARYKEPQILLDQASAEFPNTFLASDALVVDLKHLDPTATPPAPSNPMPLQEYKK
jgi:ribonuclease Z